MNSTYAYAHPNIILTVLSSIIEHDMSLYRLLFWQSMSVLYAKGFGITLDDILCYSLASSLTFSQQRVSMQISVLITMLIFVLGIINGSFSSLTFMTKISKVVGCGLYLLGSSFTSLLPIVVFT